MTIIETIRQRVWANAYVLLTLTMLMWAGIAVASRLAVGQISPMTVTALRWPLGVIVLAWLFRDQLALHRTTLLRSWRYVLAMGLLGLTAFNVLLFLAGPTTSAINMGILQGAIPIFVLIGAFLAHRTRFSGVQVVGVCVTVAGIAVVASQGDYHVLASLSFTPGDILMVFAAMFYAGFTVALKSRPAVPGAVLFTGFAIAASIVSLPMLLIEIALGYTAFPTPRGWLVLAYVVLGPTLLSQIFFMRAVELIGPGRAGLFVNLCPVFAPVLAVLVAGERLHPYHALALVLVLGGIFIAEGLGRRARNG